MSESCEKLCQELGVIKLLVYELDVAQIVVLENAKVLYSVLLQLVKYKMENLCVIRSFFDDISFYRMS